MALRPSRPRGVPRAVAASSSGPVTCSGQQSPRRGERRGVTVMTRAAGSATRTCCARSTSADERPDRAGPVTSRCSPGCSSTRHTSRARPSRPIGSDQIGGCLAIVGDAVTTRPRKVLDGHPLRQPVDGRCRPRAGVGAPALDDARATARGRSATSAICTSRPQPATTARPLGRSATAAGRSPSRSASAGSPSRKTSRSPTAPETASGSAPGRSTVAATAMPAAGPSTSTRSRRSATSPPSRSATTCRHAASPSTTRRTDGAPPAVRPSSRDASRSTRRATRSSSVRAITAPTWGRSASSSGRPPPSIT